MNRENHTVTLPVQDYEELIKNQINGEMKEVTGGPIREATLEAIKRNYPDSNPNNIDIYFIVRR